MFTTWTIRLKRSRLGEIPSARAFSLSRLISSPLWGNTLHCRFHIKTNSFFTITVIRTASSVQCSLVTQCKKICWNNLKRKFTKDWISEEIIEMRLFVTILFAVVSVSTAQHQQEVDPAYLRQYYAQIAQQAGAEQRAAPIYEQQEQPQYHQQAAPLRNVSYFPPLLNCTKGLAVEKTDLTVISPKTVPEAGRSTAASLRATTSASTTPISAWTGESFVIIAAT